MGSLMDFEKWAGLFEKLQEHKSALFKWGAPLLATFENSNVITKQIVYPA